jgi:hypothetical protein
MTVRAKKHVRFKSRNPGSAFVRTGISGTKVRNRSLLGFDGSSQWAKIMRLILIILIVAAIFYGIDSSMYDGHYFTQLLRMLRDMGLPL